MPNVASQQIALLLIGPRKGDEFVLERLMPPVDDESAPIEHRRNRRSAQASSGTDERDWRFSRNRLH